MQEDGILEFIFLYADIEYFISVQFDEDKKTHSGYILWKDEEELKRFDDFEILISSPAFNEKTLAEIWDDIEILSIDGDSESEFDPQTKYLREYEDWQWQYNLGIKRSFFAQMKVAFLACLVCVGLSAIFPLCGVSNWFFTALVAGISVVTLILTGVVIWRNRIEYGYYISSEKIVIYNGIVWETTYENIIAVKLKKSILKNTAKTIKLYVKKGWSINYTLRNIPDAERVYNLIMENRKNANS